MKHDQPHPLAGKTVTLNDTTRKAPDVEPGMEYRIEDYWDRVAGMSWMHAEGNPAAIKYAMRSGFGGLPVDDEVVYGKIGPFGHLIHVSELGDVVETVGA